MSTVDQYEVIVIYSLITKLNKSKDINKLTEEKHQPQHHGRSESPKQQRL